MICRVENVVIYGRGLVLKKSESFGVGTFFCFGREREGGMGGTTTKAEKHPDWKNY